MLLPEPGSIPQELAERPQWVCWRYEQVRGRQTKVPYSPHGGKAATDDPATWGTLAEAVERARSGAIARGYDGIGFVVTAEDPYCGIDLDHCVVDGEIAPWALEVVRALGSYTEFTPSGNGLRVWLRGVLPGWGHKKVNATDGVDVEMYDRLRFFTFTGRRLPDAPAEIRERQAEVDALHAQVFGTRESAAPASAAAPAAPAAPVTADDNELLSRILQSRNGEAFAGLWAGDTSAHDGDESAADLALCNYLAFWTGGDAARMDRLFRQSGLMRAKWDSRRGGSTYGQGTIERALAGKGEFYSEPLRVDLGGKKSEGKPAAGTMDRPPVSGIPEGLPRVQVNNRQLRHLTEETLAALVRFNEPPVVFVRLGALARIVLDERGAPRIEALSDVSVKNYLTAAANFVVHHPETKNHEEYYANTTPPGDVAKAILSLGAWSLPPLEGVVRCPILRADGTVSMAPGYDRKSQTYFCPDPALQVPAVSDCPTREERKTARSIIEDLLVDFPFADAASRANAVALLLTPIVLRAVDGPVPMALLDAPMPGTGKSLLANVVSLVATGGQAQMMPEPAREDDAELRKLITSMLLTGASIGVFDNITRPIESGIFSTLLTARVWRDRIMGRSEVVSLPQNTVWIATGNNLAMGRDNARRAYMVKLDAKTSTPENREGFRHPNITAYAIETRGRCLWALLTLARSWYAENCPPGKSPRKGSFEAWQETLAGILTLAGYEGFLANDDQMRAVTATAIEEWESFLLVWQGLHGALPQTARQLAEEIIEANGRPGTLSEVLPADIEVRGDDKAGLARCLGIRLRRNVDVRYGKNGVRLEMASVYNGHKNVPAFRVVDSSPP